MIGARAGGWWRDPNGAKRALLDRLGSVRREEDGAVVVVLDGRPLPDRPEGLQGGVSVLYAESSGRDAADDRIVALVSECGGEGTLVYTSDRALRRRVEALGARVAGALAFWRWVEGRAAGG